jgi:hypothetical protein
MQRISFLSAAAVVLLAACQDKPAKPQSPTAPKAPSLSVSVPAAAAGSSTVCLAYVKDRDAAKAALAANPSDADAQQKVTSLDALIADACN